jgi:hypothetical protein
MEGDGRPIVELETAPSQIPQFVVQDLLDELDRAGYAARMADVPETRDAQTVTYALLWVADKLAPGAALRLAEAAVRWAVNRFKGRRGTKPLRVKVLYRPDGTVLAEVPIPDDDKPA